MDAAEAVDTYGASWNEPDAQRRAALLEQAWADDGVYLDPTARAEGREALVEHIGGFQVAMPGHTIDMTSGVDVHGDVFRFAWVMRTADGDVLEGMDYGELADDGRISRIVGFFGPFPDASA
jgi:SnoaL-like domain